MPGNKGTKNYYPRYVYLANDNPNIKTKINGVSASAQTCISVNSAGKFAGDGYNGLLVSTRLSPVGTLFFINGNQTLGINGQLNCAELNGRNGRTFTWPSGVYGGGAATVVDSNADGKPDIASSAYGMDNFGGVTCVAFGGQNTGSDGTPVSFLGLDPSKGFCTSTTEQNSYSGTTLCGVDYYGDGFPGLGIPALLASPEGQTIAGSYYFFKSQPDIAPTGRVALNNPNGTTVLRRNGAKAGDRFGEDCGVSNFNGGKQELVVGASHASPNGVPSAGSVYNFIENSGPDGSTLNVTQVNSTSLITIHGTKTSGLCGYSFPKREADFNGDGFKDLAIGCASGEINIAWGPLNPADVVYLNPQHNVTVIPGPIGGGCYITGAADFNGDDMSELIRGCYNLGTTDVIFGRKTFSHVKNFNVSSDNQTITFIGADPTWHAGYGVTGVDLNEDGLDEVVIGEPDAPANGIPGAGGCHVYFGDVSPVIEKVSLHIPDGVDVLFDDSAIVVTDANHAPGNFTYQIKVGNGYVYNINDPTTHLSNFNLTHAQLASKQYRIKSLNHAPLTSLQVGVTTPGLAYLPLQDVTQNVTFSKTVPPQPTQNKIVHIQGQGPSVLNTDNLDASSVYTAQQHDAIKLSLKFENYKCTFNSSEATNQTATADSSTSSTFNGTLADLASNATECDQVGDGFPSGVVVYTDDTGLSSPETPINFQYFGLANNTAPGLLGALPELSQPGYAPKCTPMTPAVVAVYNTLPGSNPSQAQYQFSPGQNVMAAANSSSPQSIGSTPMDGQDINYQNPKYCLFPTANGYPAINVTITDPVSGKVIGPFAMKFPKFTYRPSIVNAAFTGNNAVTQSTPGAVSPAGLLCTDRLNDPPTPDEQMKYTLFPATHADYSTTHGASGGTSTALTLPTTVQGLNISALEIIFTPDSSTITPTATAQCCGFVSCTEPFSIAIKLNINYPAPTVTAIPVTAVRGDSVPLAGSLQVQLTQIDTTTGQQVAVTPGVLNKVMVRWSNGVEYGAIYDAKQQNGTVSFSKPPIPLVPYQCTVQKYNSGDIKLFSNGSQIAPIFSIDVESPPTAGSIPNNDGSKQVFVNMPNAVVDPTFPPGQKIAGIGRNKLVPLKLVGSSPFDTDSTLKWQTANNNPAVTGLTYYARNSTTGRLEEIGNDYQFSSTDMKANKIWVGGWNKNTQTNAAFLLTNSDGRVTQQVMDMSAYETQIEPPTMISSQTLQFEAGQTSRFVTQGDINSQDNPGNTPLNTDFLNMKHTVCILTPNNCMIESAPGFSPLTQNVTADATCVSGLTGTGVLTRQYEWTRLQQGECIVNITATNVPPNAPAAGLSSEPFQAKGTVPPPLPVTTTDNTVTFVSFGVTGFSIASGCAMRYCTHLKNKELAEFTKGASEETQTVKARLRSKILKKQTLRITLTHSVLKLGCSDLAKLEKYKSADGSLVEEFARAGIVHNATDDDALDVIADKTVDAQKFLPVITGQSCMQKRCWTYFGCRREIEPEDIGYEQIEHPGFCYCNCGSVLCSSFGCGSVNYTIADLDKISPHQEQAIVEVIAENVPDAGNAAIEEDRRNNKALRSRMAIFRKTMDLLPEHLVEKLKTAGKEASAEAARKRANDLKRMKTDPARDAFMLAMAAEVTEDQAERIVSKLPPEQLSESELQSQKPVGAATGSGHEAGSGLRHRTNAKSPEIDVSGAALDNKAAADSAGGKSGAENGKISSKTKLIEALTKLLTSPAEESSASSGSNVVAFSGPAKAAATGQVASAGSRSPTSGTALIEMSPVGAGASDLGAVTPLGQSAAAASRL